MALIPETQVMPLARLTGAFILLQIGLGILASQTFAAGININLSADLTATPIEMLERQQDVRLRAYSALLSFAISAFVALGQLLILKREHLALTGWALAMALGAAGLSLLGGVAAMNVAELSSDVAYTSARLSEFRLPFATILASSDYTSFHMALVAGSLANAGFYLAFWGSRRIPAAIAIWGLCASLFVATAIVGRDFAPLLRQDAVTIAFMSANLLGLVATGLYLAIKGVRIPTA